MTNKNWEINRLTNQKGDDSIFKPGFVYVVNDVLWFHHPFWRWSQPNHVLLIVDDRKELHAVQRPVRRLWPPRVADDSSSWRCGQPWSCTKSCWACLDPSSKDYPGILMSGTYSKQQRLQQRLHKIHAFWRCLACPFPNMVNECKWMCQWLNTRIALLEQKPYPQSGRNWQNFASILQQHSPCFLSEGFWKFWPRCMSAMVWHSSSRCAKVGPSRVASAAWVDSKKTTCHGERWTRGLQDPRVFTEKNIENHMVTQCYPGFLDFGCLQPNDKVWF